MDKRPLRGSAGAPSRRSPLVVISSFLLVVAAALAAALFLVGCGANHPTTSALPAMATASNATVVALQTLVTNQQAQVVVQQTAIARQQQSLARLQQQNKQLLQTVTAQRTPGYQANGAHSYVAAFQIGTYRYVLYLQWTESNGSVFGGRMLTSDSLAPSASRSYQFNGLDNDGRFNFTATGGGATIIFSGTIGSNGTTFTVRDLPWSVFSGFTGGSFTQTLHTGTMQDYDTYRAHLPNPS